MVSSSYPNLQTLLARLQKVRKVTHGWTARCPAHRDKHPSLSIDLGEQGQILLKCFAGCSLEAIVQAVGMSMTELFPTTSAPPTSASRQNQHQPLTLLVQVQETFCARWSATGQPK
jgi:hypothetical protein